MDTKQLIIADIEKKDRERIAVFFKNLGLEVQNISKTEIQTPDFQIYLNKELFAYCEVKSIMEDKWMKGERPDPVYNRIQNKIHEAVKQLRSVNPKNIVPNIVLILNHDKRCGKPDLHIVLKGKFLSTEGEIDFDTRYRNRLLNKGDLSNLDLVIWIDDNNKPYYYFLVGSPYKEVLTKKLKEK